jgi:hypothetical protein
MVRSVNNRNMIFVSHAWEDFEFSKWLALQLAKEGYGVWCDVTKLLGGENWPREINDALQNRTARFFFVLSKSSNTKDDPLGEFESARKIMKREGLKRFIVPLKLDDISRDEVDYRLQEIQSISFESSWAEGLSNTLKFLREEKVPMHESFNPSQVNQWWRKYGTDACEVVPVSENLYSNRFPILSYPRSIYAHFVDEEPRLVGQSKCPLVPFKAYILSFADCESLQRESGVKSRILESYLIPTDDIIQGTDQLIKNSKTGSYFFIRLLNHAAEMGVRARSLDLFRLSRSECYFFHEGLLVDGRIRFTNSGELNSRIKLWGKFGDERWYWAIRIWAEREPTLHYTIQSHVLVGGQNGIRAAPKAVYNAWRNDKWRDKLKSTLAHLAQDTPEISLNVGGTQEIKFSQRPIQYVSPVSYEEPQAQADSIEGAIDE